MIAILGGGIAGSSLAWALAQRGRSDVEVFDPNPFATGSTARATGGYRTQFASSFNVQLSLHARPFFLRHSNDIAFRQTGYALVACDKDSEERLDAWRELQLELGLPVDRMSADTLFPPSLTFPRDACANFCRLDGVFDPTKLLSLFRATAEQKGVSFHYQTPFEPETRFDTIVIAAGAWSREVGTIFGLDIDVTPERRRAWMLGGLHPSAGMPLGIDLSTGWVFRERDGLMLAVSPPFRDPDTQLRQWLSDRAACPKNVQIVDRWEGLYEVTPDHHPFVGASEVPGVWLSCGFSGHGVMHAPPIAEGLAAMILGDTPPIDLSCLNPNRTTALQELTSV